MFYGLNDPAALVVAPPYVFAYTGLLELIWGAGLSAAIAMAAYLLSVHPGVRRQLTVWTE
jgi:hypothetical protein